MGMKEIITKIKLFLNEEISTETNLVDVKTTDGLILSFDTLEVGKELFIVDQAGRTPAPDGEYILEDGTNIKATGGLIEEISLPEPIVEEPVDPNVPVDPNAMPMMPDMAELVAKVKKCEEDNIALAEVVAQLAENFSKMSFKEEVKMSKVKEKVETEQVFNNKKISHLDHIFKNMYK